MTLEPSGGRTSADLRHRARVLRARASEQTSAEAALVLGARADWFDRRADDLDVEEARLPSAARP